MRYPTFINVDKELVDRSADRSVVHLPGCTARRTTELRDHESFDSMNSGANDADPIRSLGDRRYRDDTSVCYPDIQVRNAQGDDTHNKRQHRAQKRYLHARNSLDVA